MSQFLTTVCVFVFIYKFFELFVHRKERLNAVDKMDFSQSNSFDPNVINALFSKIDSDRYVSLKWGCFLVGVGIGIGVGILICSCAGVYYPNNTINNIVELKSMIYFGSIFAFGGAGLLTAFLIKKRKQKEEENA